MKSLSCPSCGGSVELKSSITLMVICPYCDSTLLRRDLDVELIGKMATLKEDGSIIQKGTRGKYRGSSFEVIGRIQLHYTAGFWNEWFLLFEEGKPGWLGEAQGNYAVSFVTETTDPLPPFERLEVGEVLRICEESFTVSNIESARCIGGEGELPFRVGPGYDLPAVDLTGKGNRFATLDYSESPPLVFVGESLDFDDLSFTDVKEIEGW